MLDLKFLFISVAITSTSLIWRKLLKDLPKLKSLVERVVGKAGTCGFCYTFWFSLLVMIVIDPSIKVVFYLRDWVPGVLKNAIEFLLSWLVLGYTALMFRTIFLYISNLQKASGHAHEKFHVA